MKNMILFIDHWMMLSLHITQQRNHHFSSTNLISTHQFISKENQNLLLGFLDLIHLSLKIDFESHLHLKEDYENDKVLMNILLYRDINLLRNRQQGISICFKIILYLEDHQQHHSFMTKIPEIICYQWVLIHRKEYCNLKF